MKKTAYQSRKRIKQVSFRQEAWGDRTIYEIELPEGKTPEEYAKELNDSSPYGGGYTIRFYVENGKVLEDYYFSIGD